MVAAPPPIRTSFPPAAALARSSAAAMPSVTKWNVVPPSVRSGGRRWWVRGSRSAVSQCRDGGEYGQPGWARVASR